jgi:flavorubredoxin
MEINNGVYWVGVNDTKSRLFESLWSLPNGASYNSYLIVGSENKALIDTVHIDFFEEYYQKINKITDLTEIDYIILNHVEPDHSGSLSKIIEKIPNVKVVSSLNGIEFTRKYHQGEFEDFIVKDGSSIDLGGKTLRFIETNCIHWPETISSFIDEDGVLFSGDLFGSFGAIGENIFDDRFDSLFLDEVRRYFASILSPYSPFVKKAIMKYESLGIHIRTIAPTHGLIYTTNPEKILNIYTNLSSGKFEEKVVIVYGSMYGNTKIMAEAISKGVTDKGVRSILFNISYSEMSDVLSEIWQAPAIAVGSPVYDSFIFPPISSFLEMIRLKRIKSRSYGIFGNFTWGGGPFKQLEKTILNQGSEVVGDIIKAQGLPNEDSINQAYSLGNKLADVAIKKTK